MVNYAKYGKDNPFTYRLSEEELNSVTPDEIAELIKDIFSYKQRIYYYGPLDNNGISNTLNKEHRSADELKSLKVENEFIEKDSDENKVYVVNYDMQQAEIVMLSKRNLFDRELLPYSTLYNEYFGGGMGSVVFQELRESKALAYSTFSIFQSPKKQANSFYNVAYIGTQADKLSDAMSGMTDLLKNFPVSESAFRNAKSSVIKQIQSDRVMNAGLLNKYENSLKLGLEENIDSKIYESVYKMELDDIIEFQRKNIKDNKYSILILADINKIDMNTLKKYGEVKVLTLEEVFGY